jgi:hypothetical protein
MVDYTEKRRASRRKDHIAKDLRTPKYRERAVPSKLSEDEQERRFRRFNNFDEYFAQEGWHPYDQDED